MSDEFKRKLEAYEKGELSASELEESEEVFQLFEGKNMDLIRLAVDTGLEATDDWYEGIIFEPIGFQWMRSAFGIGGDQKLTNKILEK